jgi:hypothetical protein
MNTPSKSCLRLNYPSWPRPRSHGSATGPRNQQLPSRIRERSGTATRVQLTYTGQAGEHHRSDRSLLAKPMNFHRRPLHRSGRCSSPIKPVQAKKPQIHQIGLPSSKLNESEKSSNTGQQRTHPDVHPRQNPQSLCTGQTGQAGPLGDEQDPRVNYSKSNSRSLESLHGFVQDFGDSRNTSWALHSQDLVHQNLLNQE